MNHLLTIIVPYTSEEELLLIRWLKSAQSKSLEANIIIIKMGEWNFIPSSYCTLPIRVIDVPLMNCAEAKNYGVQNANTKFIMFQDADNWLKGNKIYWEKLTKEYLSNCNKNLICLQRGEEDRKLFDSPPNRWNFTRHVINWSVIWDKEHFINMGGFDENYSPGCKNMSQCGEEISLFFKHFENYHHTTVFFENLVVAHPSLGKPVTLKRHFEYSYGVTFATLFQLKRRPSFFTFYWFLRTIMGIFRDLVSAIMSKKHKEKVIILSKLTAFKDIFNRKSPRLRASTPKFITRVDLSTIE